MANVSSVFTKHVEQPQYNNVSVRQCKPYKARQGKARQRHCHALCAVRHDMFNALWLGCLKRW